MKMTVGMLRSVLTGLPDDMPVVVFSDQTDSFVDWDYRFCSPDDGWADWITERSFMIFTEN
jgi:hypothetical protein